MTRPLRLNGKRADLQMTLALGAAVVAAAAIAFATSRTSAEPAFRSEEPPPTGALASPTDPEPAAADANLSGEVLETLPVSKYTYLRLRSADGEVWAAVPSANVAVGSRVAIANATRMADFKSTTLKRTFEVIYFGNLAAASPVQAVQKFAPLDVPQLDDDSALPPGHPAIGAAAPLGTVADSDPLPPGHPDIDAATPQGATAGGNGELPLPALEIAPTHGANAHVISELASQRQTLAGKRVRVRAEVTKVTPDVSGHAFFHLRDESGAGSPRRPADLVATALEPPARGQVAIFEGTLRTDVDVGIGYKYPMLLENATIVGP